MAYRDNIDFKIDISYVLTDEDNTLIDSGKNSGKTWSDNFYKPFKERVRKHLRIKQKGRCAFCRLRIPKSQFYPHLEHIVSKTARKEFEYLPVNLVWCCQRCNFDKGVENTLVDAAVLVYPVSSDAFKIVNPYHDYFFDHLDLIEDLIIVNVEDSEKGTNTYNYYSLERIEIAEDRAFELKTQDSNLTKEEIIGILTLRLAKENDIRIQKLIQRHLKNLPDWIIE